MLKQVEADHISLPISFEQRKYQQDQFNCPERGIFSSKIETANQKSSQKFNRHAYTSDRIKIQEVEEETIITFATNSNSHLYPNSWNKLLDFTLSATPAQRGKVSKRNYHQLNYCKIEF